MIDRLGRWMSNRSNRTEAMLVTRDRRRWVQTLAFDVVMVIAAFVGWTLYPPGGSGLLNWIASIVVGLAFARVAWSSARRAQAYRNGWLRGRSEFVQSLVEAERRGMEPGEWLVAQAERDWKVLGFEHDEIAAVMESIRRQAEDE